MRTMTSFTDDVVVVAEALAEGLVGLDGCQQVGSVAYVRCRDPWTMSWWSPRHSPTCRSTRTAATSWVG